MKRHVRVVLGLIILAAISFTLFRPGNSPQAARLQADEKTDAAQSPSSSFTSSSSPASLAGTNGAPVAPATNRVINPYAGALKVPGKSKRAWDTEFIAQFQNARDGDAIRFELTEGRMAEGIVRITQHRNGEVSYVSGILTAPETGEFFFLKPPGLGVAGKAVGVVQFPGSQTAYRIEPTGIGGEPELWERRLDEVICVSMPKPMASIANAATDTNQPAEITPLRPDEWPTVVPGYNSNIVSLQSLPGARGVLLLDFAGGYTPTWDGVYYSKPAAANNNTIRDVWKRVAEDYLPFNINVTTDIKVFLQAPAMSRQRVAFTDTPVTAAGVAFFGSWNWGGDTPCWSVYITGKASAEVASHEAGHTLGLAHQGQGNGVTTTNEYYGGHGSGETGWAPIMGVGYYQPAAQWAKGEYNAANEPQDELSVIVNNNNDVDYRADDTGNTLATSRHLEIHPDDSVSAEGVIERTGDTDAFQFTTTGGMVSLIARPVADWANLGLAVVIANSANIIIHSNNPQNTLWARITTNLAAGTYTFRVIGVGKNNPLNTGFSSYGSLGYYSIVGTVPGGRQPTRLSVYERVANGTVVGTVPASAGGNLAYSIASGNSGGTFTIDNGGVLSVANNALLNYEQRATNSMYFAGFELFVNILNLDEPSLDELNRRVVVNVLSANLGYPLAVSGFNARIIVPHNATTASPGATGFDIPNNWAFYQEGLNGNAQISASGQGLQGLPADRLLRSQVDGSVFELGPYGGTNALMLGNGYPASGTLTLATPQPFNKLAILATSANGGGVGTLVLNFTNGTKSQVFNLNAQDWYNTTANVAAQGFGRVRLGQATFTTENPGWNNPNIYQTTIDLAALGLNQTVASISITNPTAGGSRTTAILGVSGLAMPAAVAITKQPVSATNNVPTAPVTFSVTAMGAPSLGYQWYKGNPGSGTLLPGQTSTNLVLNSIQLTDAGDYYVVVTNSSSAATSTVATLTVYRAPQIVQQPAPANSTRAVGKSISFSVVANAALPVSYYWRTNGVNIPGAANAATLNLPNVQVANAGSYSVLVSNQFGSVVSSSVTLNVVPLNYPYAELVLAHNPMGYWRLNELTGPTAFDCVGGRNGTYNSTLLGQPGHKLVDTHTSARFGFLATQNSYVGGIPVDFGSNANNSLTVEAWVKSANLPSSDAGLITKGTGAGGEQFNLDCGGPGRAFRFFVREDDGSAVLATGNIVPNTQWQHVVGVLNRSAGYVALYVNGVSNASSAFRTENYRGLLRSANAMTIGARQSGSGAYDHQFPGYMQDVAVYNYALSAGQILSHYQAASNRAPAFVANPFTKPGIVAGQNYSGTLAGEAVDPNGDVLTYTKISGPSWLLVAGNGALAGTPLSANLGTNSFVVRATDGGGLFSNATMNVNVSAAPAIVLGLSWQELNLSLSWSGGIAPYQVQATTNLAEAIWEDVGGPTSGFNLLLTPSNSSSFYRVFGQ
ncbi:MAG TPA: LamG-like jellyroll fold domain-containing protein [Verrucomicrobiae bacterium]|nr:LamG-like jellyroll fold domain-containing protein [Verrucomicrobiae bacterium]